MLSNPLRHLAREGPPKAGGCWTFFIRGMAKKEDCWMPICGVVVRRVPADNTREKCRINRFLMEHLFKDDPFMKAAGMEKNEPDPGLLQSYASSYNDNISLYALLEMTNEIIGVMVNALTKESYIKQLHRLAENTTYCETGKYVKMLALTEENGNVYRSYSADTVWSTKTLVTARNYRRRGIAKILLKTNLELARKEKKAKLMKVVSTNTYLSRAALSCGGLRTHYSKHGNEFRDEKGNKILDLPVCPPHGPLDLFISELGEKK